MRSFIYPCQRESPVAVWAERGWTVTAFVALLIMVAVGCGGGGPRTAEARREHERGLGLLEDGKLGRADAAFRSAIALDPTLAEGYLGRGMVFETADDQGRALVYLNRAIELDPKLATAYDYRGRVYMASDDSDQAVANFSRAIQLDPQLAEPYYYRGMVSRQAEDYLAAIDDMSSVIALENGAPKFLMERAELYLLAGDPENAALDLERVISTAQDEGVVLDAKRGLASIRESGTR